MSWPPNFFANDFTVRSKSEDAIFFLYEELVTSYGELVSVGEPGAYHCRILFQRYRVSRRDGLFGAPRFQIINPIRNAPDRQGAVVFP